MKLSTLLEFRLSQLLTPFREKHPWPDSTRDHVLANAVGGLVVWITFFVFARCIAMTILTLLQGPPSLAKILWFPGIAFASAMLFKVLWVFLVEEKNTSVGSRYPLWSMIWDFTFAGLGGGAGWTVFLLILHR